MDETGSDALATGAASDALAALSDETRLAILETLELAD